MRFSGFVRGTRATPLPDPMFGLLLEQMQDLAELKVVLRGVWLRNQKKGSLRGMTLEEFLNDPVLLRGLSGGEISAPERIRRGLGLAVQRGVFLHCPEETGAPGLENGGDQTLERGFFLLNTYQDRQALAQLCQGRGSSVPANAMDVPAELPPEARHNVFALYEDNIGTMGPIMAETLKAAEAQYPAAWIAEAFGIAIAQNKRSWAYIEAILRRWAAEGKDHGEPGRHPPPDHGQKYLEEYQRRRGRLPWEPGNP
ncbi:MAG TPA: DnaD domain protein [Dehalococcoidia bacterium]|nr:DnaD domain protein [Dehalococcoidia bacterium]